MLLLPDDRCRVPVLFEALHVFWPLLGSEPLLPPGDRLHGVREPTALLRFSLLGTDSLTFFA